MPDDLENQGGDDAELNAKIAAAVDASTKGLKDTNAALKSEKTALKEQLDNLSKTLEDLGGLDTLKALGSADTIKQLTEMQKRFANDEQGKLLQEGKYDEWFDRRTEALRKDQANQLKTIQDQLAAEREKVGTVERALRSKVLETEVSDAGAKAGIVPEAALDVRLRASNEFTFDSERGRFVMKDADGGIVFGKDGATPKTIQEWLEDQKETSRHWFPPSKGGGAEGSDRGKTSKGLEALDMRDYIATRTKQGFKSF